MDFETFSTRAREITGSIPPQFMEEIETVEVHLDAKKHPHLPDVLTLGECETSPLSDPTGTEPFRSIVHIYYGSFVELSKADPAFDVDGELVETIQHEVQHHLEDRAGLDDLRDEDALFEMHARFRGGLDVPPGWYRRGKALESGLWAVDLDVFLELELRRADWDRLPGSHLTLTILDEPFEIDVPPDMDPEEIWSFEGEGLMEGEEDEEEVVVPDAEESEDEPPPLTGDLHVVPLVR